VLSHTYSILVLSFCDGCLRASVYHHDVRILFILFDFVFCMRGAPELVLHKKVSPYSRSRRCSIRDLSRFY